MKLWSQYQMVLYCLVILFHACSVQADDVSHDDDTIEWANFKSKHHKHYMTHTEDMKRFNQWLTNRALILQHNSNPTSAGYTLDDNEFSDWLPNEYKTLLGFRSKSSKTQNSQQQLSRRQFMPTINPVPPQYNPYTQTVPVSDLPASINWTAKGAVNPVQNQGQCGDCWSFSACGALEGQYFLTTGQSAIMSEQNLLDCTFSYGNDGCNGGAMTSAFQYVEQNKGIDASSSYPYTGTNGTCKYNSANNVGYNTGYQSVETGKELALQQAVALVGPISVGIDAGQPSFQLYRSGVYSSPKCSSVNLDHAVLCVGYGTYNGQDYWLLKNSWGTSWGMQGYMMMARNENNMCGIATDASFPISFTASNNVISDNSGYQASGSTKIASYVHFVAVILLLQLICNFLF